MNKENILLACLYCADVMEKPRDETIEKFGSDMFRCCDHKMIEIDMNEMYKVVRALDTLKENVEAEMIRGL